MTFTLGTANIAQTSSQSEELLTISAVQQRAEVVCWQEARDAHGALIALRGWFSVESGGLAISWEFARLTSIAHGSKTVMAGGRRGTGRVGDNRRRGPSRQVLWVVLEEKSTRRRVIVATHHAVARADTQHKWRRPLRAQGFAGVVVELRTVQRRYPGVPLVLTGDFNTVGPITAFAVLGIREVATPATYGRLRYDRVLSSAPISGVRPLTTRSDHRALLATVTLGVAVPQAPVTVPQQPTAASAQRPAARPPPRPVRRPWQRFSRRWRRRHPRLWHRIAVWRRRNPR